MLHVALLVKLRTSCWHTVYGPQADCWKGRNCTWTTMKVRKWEMAHFVQVPHSVRLHMEQMNAFTTVQTMAAKNFDSHDGYFSAIFLPISFCTPIPKDSPFPLGSVFGFLFTGLCLDHLITSIWMTQVFISSPDLSPESQAQTLNSYRHPSSEFNSTLASVSPHCRTQGSKLMAACTLLAVSRCRPSVPSSTHAPCPLHPCSISPHLLPSMHIT